MSDATLQVYRPGSTRSVFIFNIIIIIIITTTEGRAKFFETQNQLIFKLLIFFSIIHGVLVALVGMQMIYIYGMEKYKFKGKWKEIIYVIII